MTKAGGFLDSDSLSGQFSPEFFSALSDKFVLKTELPTKNMMNGNKDKLSAVNEYVKSELEKIREDMKSYETRIRKSIPEDVEYNISPNTIQEAMVKS